MDSKGVPTSEKLRSDLNMPMRKVGGGTRWGTLMACYEPTKPTLATWNEAAPGRNHGHAVSNPRMRACSTVV
jgi:hypothetical protein